MKKNRIVLISTPWPLYNRPSIQLGALKAYLRSTHPDLEIDAGHVYLKLAEKLGYRLYRHISERTWLAESIYAALLYPNQFQKIDALFNREIKSNSLLSQTGLKDIATQTQQTTDAIIASFRWSDYLLAGFSVSLCQLTSSLYFIKKIKKRFPNLAIVVGGSTFSGTVSDHFFDVFPEIDAVVNGEGELPLSQLISSLMTTPDITDLPPIKGVLTPQTTESGGPQTDFNQLDDLNPLPIPDFDDYFALLQSFNPDKTFFPILPIEISRGCWWKKTKTNRKPKSNNFAYTSGCAFCNLNRQWQGYRSKKPDRVVAEIDHLTNRYQNLSLTVVDNVLPKTSSMDVFKAVTALGKDLKFFAEIRANSSASELAVMKSAGMHELQIGIEAISTSLLKKLQKGTRAIQNLEIMRNCEELGIINRSNLILNFPGSDEQDVSETLRNMEFALPFHPLQPVNFWLGHGSPVWRYPERHGIKAIYNHPNWSCLFPRRICRQVEFVIQTYRGDMGLQKNLWRPVKNKIRQWQRSYDLLQQDGAKSPILSYRDGHNFLIIKERRLQKESIKHRLVGTSRKIYLFCRRHRSLIQIRNRFSKFAEDQIIAFLRMMVDKKLMFQEEDTYLSLAVSRRSPNPGNVGVED